MIWVVEKPEIAIQYVTFEVQLGDVAGRLGNKTVNKYPKYKCDKVVPAFKILRIGKGESEVAGDPPFYNLWPTDHDLDPFEVSQAWIAKHQPHAGGYCVFYKDGYTSFSPADAFEDGYTLKVNAQKRSSTS